MAVAKRYAGLVVLVVLAILAPPPVMVAAARSPELSVTTRLADRRVVVTGDRFWSLGTADGRFPAAGWHTRGEMGGFFAPPIKVLDGLWFGVDGQWLPAANRMRSGWGYARTEYPASSGLRVTRTDFSPDGERAGLIGLTLVSDHTRTIKLAADAHSELMGMYPWGETKPSQSTVNLPDTASVSGSSLLFRDVGTPPGENQVRHDWAAAVGTSLKPSSSAVGKDFRGPQDPPVICPASGPGTPDPPARCDDSAYGKGAGGQLAYSVMLPAWKPVNVWFGVAGSDTGPAAAQSTLGRVLKDPAGLLAAKIRARQAVAGRTVVDLPGDPLLARSVAWTKQNLADSVQEAHNLRLRPTAAGTVYPPPVGTLDTARWYGAGFPDYSWIFGTDGEYTAFAAVAAGQFEDVAAHLRTLRDISDKVNKRSGKIVHEVTPDGQVYFGANSDPGNTDETAKFPSAVALLWRWSGDRRFLNDMYDASVRAMRYVSTLDADHDGWPEGLGNVERPGMGPEKLDNAVYAIRGYADLADLAVAKGDRVTAGWAAAKAADVRKRFEDAWWFGGDTASYADSLTDANAKVFQRHWIGLTPAEVELPGNVPLASPEHGVATLVQHEKPCYTGEFGLFHTGTGPSNPGPACDSAVSSVPSERSVFTLNTSIIAVAEGNYGRSARAYTTGNARVQLDPSVWEMPGAMPEISPSPDFGANIDKKLIERSMVLQAWGAYGILWPVVHQQLGVDPDAGDGRVRVVPQIPTGQQRIAGGHIRVGPGEVSVSAVLSARTLTVTASGPLKMTIGAVLPAGTTLISATLNGKPVRATLTQTGRGLEATVPGAGILALSLR
ncbi:glycogen debranching protein [Fodinicola acaciae]|uniref:glycogen debranching protein n=1 Tax=Fodinicola acaciae TaxID=2681555 RepID=UPI0013D02020|nr:glycogen debranching protein [Fodinicola acaciae]